MSTTNLQRPHSVSDDRELTVMSLSTGLILSVVMGAANVYLGLRVGMTVSASIPAAVLATGVLRGLFNRRSILEANLVQTTASAGESLAAGIIFTMPALIITGIWSEFDFWTTTLIALSGGLLGILMMIPMRQAIVVESTELKFPEGVACAEVLKAGAAEHDEDGHVAVGTRLVFGGLAVGAIIKFCAGYLGVLKSSVEHATRAGGRTWYFGMDVSPALVAVGLIVGLPVASQVFLGGALGWYLLMPLLSYGPTESLAVDHAFSLWSSEIRYIGVGAMIVGGLSAIWSVRHGITAAFRELVEQVRSRGTSSSPSSEVDLAPPERNLEFGYMLSLGLFCAAVVFGVYFVLLDRSIGITMLATVAALVLSFFFTAVASYIVGLVGNSNSPVSGMTISAVLLTGLMLWVGDYSGRAGILAMLGVAGVVCCVACTAGDVCNDLKTGQLVGASPRNQQIAQVLGVLGAAFIMAPVLTILHEGSLNAGTGGIGGEELVAPQAGLFASLAEGFFGNGNIPWDMVGWGVGLAVLILLADIPLAIKKSSFRLHVMPVAVGIYLPAELSVPILFGGILNWMITSHSSSDAGEKRGVLLASGIIAGESLMGVLLGLLAFFGWTSLKLGSYVSPTLIEVVSLLVLSAVLIAMYRFAVRTTSHSGAA
ncbi:MAG: oligopeptide transporter, OPT family [Planctomycetaceae bacterium]|jgi:putative OPT family oligopeptide transporter|nr:oligopeptide transporter, OPT family [Planctomycetaceae bacterium]